MSGDIYWTVAGVRLKMRFNFRLTIGQGALYAPFLRQRWLVVRTAHPTRIKTAFLITTLVAVTVFFSTIFLQVAQHKYPIWTGADLPLPTPFLSKNKTSASSRQ